MGFDLGPKFACPVGGIHPKREERGREGLQKSHQSWGVFKVAV